MRTALRTVILVLALVSAVLALCASWLLCPGQSQAEEARPDDGPAIKIVAERLWTEEELTDRAAAIRAEETALRGSEPAPEARGADVEADLYQAALRLQPGLEKRPERARRVVGAIFEVATEESFDPYLLLAYASRESGLRANARGALGEQGLLQLHGYARRVCAKGLDLGQPRSNLRAGICWLRVAQRKCETTNVWIVTAAYGTGKCLSEEDARGLDCTKRKRAELVAAVGPAKAATIWPE